MATKSRRRRHSSSASKGLTTSSVKDYAVKGLCLIGGVAVGSAIQKFVGKKDAVSGTDLLGLDGEASKVSTPLITVGLGLASSLLLKQPHLRMVGLGMGVAGGVSLANNFLGDKKITLGGDDEPVALPGVGNIVNYDQLPTNYDVEKTFHNTPEGVNSDVDTVGDVEFEDNDDVNGVGEVLP